MIKKFLKFFIGYIKDNYKYYLTLIVVILLLSIKLDYYIYCPGSLEDLTNRIEVENSYDFEGSFNLTYVTARPGNIINIILSYIIPSWDLIDVNEMRIENENKSDIVTRDKIYLKETSYDAIIASFNEANIDYTIDNVDLTVTYVYDIAQTDILSGDIIKSINDKEITNFDELTNEISNYNPGDKVNIKVKRKNKYIDCYAILKEENNRVIIGVSLAELKNITTNPKVKYVFKKNESGSSRGLMCALDIYNKITKDDLTKGRKISGTGTINEYGEIGAIDGVKYKLAGAVKNKADIFIVPSKNYDEAISLKEKNNYDIEIISADNLHNVIEKLK